MNRIPILENADTIRTRKPKASRAIDKPKSGSSAMNWLALSMLTGDRAKYIALIFAISFSSFLITQQASIFAGLMDRTRSQIEDVTDADIWVMDPATQYVDEAERKQIPRAVTNIDEERKWQRPEG